MKTLTKRVRAKRVHSCKYRSIKMARIREQIRFQKE